MVLAALNSGPDTAGAAVQAAVYDALGNEHYAPAIMALHGAADLALETGAVLAGTAAGRIAVLGGGSLAVVSEGATADIGVYARLAAAKGISGERPRPLYLREPDAKPQAGFVLPRWEA
jgi:tRNA A37 threonylcarbamoyladenosine modification protein TsaB